MLWTREDYVGLMTFQKTDRQMLVELFGPLIGLEEEWRAQGATAGELALTDFAFDDVYRQDAGGECGLIHGLAPTILEDDGRVEIARDEMGRVTRRVKATATIALPISFPVRDREDWRRMAEKFQFEPGRIDEGQVERARRARGNGALITASIPGGFDMIRELMGDEACCLAFYDQPALVREMLDTFAETACQTLSRVSARVTIDNLCIHEDMAGKSGPLIGPNMVREFLLPYYRRVWDMLKGKGARLFSQDSDGNMNPLIDAFLECGVNVFYPCEPAAGMDVVYLRERYGERAAFKGGIDKHVLRKSLADIDRELAYKMQASMQGGGMVFGLDHRIPNGTPLSHYRHYVRRAKELLCLPETGAPMWGRMAF